MPYSRSGQDDVSYTRPRILVSRCLEFEACRYDGAMIPDDLVRRLTPLVEFSRICPEADIGLGVPRQPVRLVRSGSGIALLQHPGGRDLTMAMESFSRRLMAGLDGLDGAILKSRSPSCGTAEVRIYDGMAEGAAVSAKGQGIFASAVIAMDPDLPVESEERLRSSGIREHFLTRVFASARFRSVESEALACGTAGPLVDFHASMKLQLMTMDREEERRLGRLVASALPLREALLGYRRGLSKAMAKGSRPGPVADALMHAMGHFDTEAAPAEKAHFLDAIKSYRAGRKPLSTCLAILREWMARSPKQWLAGQVFLSPYPAGLVDEPDPGPG